VVTLHLLERDRPAAAGSGLGGEGQMGMGMGMWWHVITRYTSGASPLLACLPARHHWHLHLSPSLHKGEA
jgi:hypothetical protein